MKNIFYTIILAIVTISCRAQQTISLTSYQSKHLRNNNYIKDIDGKLDPFVGTWEWNNGSGTIFRIKFIKAIHNKTLANNTYYIDKILGGYQYIVNGVEIVNTLTFTNSVSLTDYIDFAPLVCSIDNPDFKNLHISATDKLKIKVCGADFTIQDLNSSTLTAHWRLYNVETYRSANRPPKPIDFSIPTDVILTKL